MKDLSVKIKSKQSQKTCLYSHLGYVTGTSCYTTVKDQAEDLLLSAFQHTFEDKRENQQILLPVL